MTDAPATRRRLPNPFYAALLVVSTVFVFTTLAYLMGPYVARKSLENPAEVQSAGSKVLTAWFEHHGVKALAVEFVVMLVLSILAMLTDDWFSGRKTQS